MSGPRFPVARAAARIGALAAAALGTLEALAGVALEVRLKGMYLGGDANPWEVLSRLVDVTVVPKACLLHALLGFTGLGLVGAALDVAGRARWRGSSSSSPMELAVAAFVGLVVGGVLEYGAIRRGWPGALWPPSSVGGVDAIAALPIVGVAWLAARAGRGVAERCAARIGCLRVARRLERGAWAVLVGSSVAALALALTVRPRGEATGGVVAPATKRSPDVVLVVLDTARADRFSTFGAVRPTSPRLTELARRGLLFTQAMSTAPWTLPSHGSLFTGELPHRHGADWGHMALRPEMRTLAESFAVAGYRTAAFTNNPWIGPVAGLDRGFAELFPMWRGHGGTWDRLLAVRAARRLSGRDPDEGAADTVAAITRWLDTAGAQPFFLFVNLMELHDPNWPQRGADRYLPSDTSRARLRGLNQNPYRWFAQRVTMGDADFALLRDLYDAQVSYLDGQLDALIALLEARRGAANLVIAVVGDHGENLGDHQLLSHVFSLHQSVVHVPFVLVAPGRVPPGAVVSEPVSLVDVAPTLEALAGVGAAGAPGRRGQSLIANPPEQRAERVLVAEHPPPGPILDILLANDPRLDLGRFDRSWAAAREGGWKLIVDGLGSTLLYDLASDPAELRDVANEHPEVVARLAAALTEPLAHLAPTRARALEAGGGAPLDAATRERLHALGYM
ncbi:MAG: sulfatase [bacterium]